MKKLLIAIFVLMMFIASCGENAQTGNQTGKTSPIKSGESVSKMAEIFNSPTPVTCVVTGKIQDKDTKSTIYVDGQRVRIDSEEENQIYISLFDQKTMYIWVKGSKDGMMIDLEKLNSIQGGDLGENAKSKEAIADEYDKYDLDYSCKKGSIPGATFQKPNDIEFQDLAELFEQMNNVVQKNK